MRVAIPLILGGLELAHPAWSDGSVAGAVAAAGPWWIRLHFGLLVGYALLVWAFWPPTAVARAVLAAFAVCNTVFLAIDGVVVGMLASADPAAANALWSNPLITALADLTGATWAAALLAVGAAHTPTSRVTTWLLVVIWLAFVASLVLPLATAFAAVASGLALYRAYLAGGILGGLRLGLFILAGVLRQHVGPGAALGMVTLALASLTVRERSGLAASSPL